MVHILVILFLCFFRFCILKQVRILLLFMRTFYALKVQCVFVRMDKPYAYASICCIHIQLWFWGDRYIFNNLWILFKTVKQVKRCPNDNIYSLVIGYLQSWAILTFQEAYKPSNHYDTRSLITHGQAQPSPVPIDKHGWRGLARDKLSWALKL